MKRNGYNNGLCPSHAMCGKHRFTLIELLVVIAIIAILASLLLPALRRAIEQSKTVSCKGRQKQFLVWIMNYYDDNKSWWPALSTSNPSTTFADQMAPYMGTRAIDGNSWKKTYSDNIFLCPANPYSPPNQTAGDATLARKTCIILTGWRVVNYAMNPYFGSNDQEKAEAENDNRFRFRKNTPKNPSRLMMMPENSGNGSANAGVAFTSSGQLQYNAMFHPQLRTNILFVDGHIDSFAFPFKPTMFDWKTGF